MNINFLSYQLASATMLPEYIDKSHNSSVCMVFMNDLISRIMFFSFFPGVFTNRQQLRQLRQRFHCVRFYRGYIGSVLWIWVMLHPYISRSLPQNWVVRSYDHSIDHEATPIDMGKSTCTATNQKSPNSVHYSWYVL